MKKRLLFSIVMLLVSTVALTSASFAWFSMNTNVSASGIQFEAYSDQLFLQISKSETDGFSYSVDFSSVAKAVRPVAYGSLSDENPAYDVNFVLMTEGNYVPPSAGEEEILYYFKVVKTDENDSRGEADYLLINSKLKAPSSVAGFYDFTAGNINFELQTEGVYTEGTYYEKVKNGYVPVELNAADATAGTPADELYGYYKIVTTEEVALEDSEGNPLVDEETGEPMTETVDLACAEGEVYQSGHLYYEYREGGYHPVGGLSLGTPLAGYYVVMAPEEDTPAEGEEEEGEGTEEEESGETVAAVADGETEYFVKNSAGDYISIGKISEGVALDESYTYWYKGYSNAPGNAAVNDMCAVVDDSMYNVENNPYYLFETVYLRMEHSGSEGENLRVSDVSVLGSDSLDQAVRILFVATNGRGEVSYATFDASAEEKIKHGQSGNLFDTILSDSAETVKVEMYLYYDGTHSSVVTGRELVMSGHDISVTFSIDEPYYGEYMD